MLAKKLTWPCLLLMIFPCFAEENADLAAQVQYKEQILSKLKEEIQQIDSEMDRCEKTKKGWVAATVVGGVGIAATGTAAIVQSVKINQQKKTLNELKGGQK